MRGWFTDLSAAERRTFWACFSGWALDAMDVQLYAVAMPTLIAIWGLTKSQGGTLATTALVVSSLGGVIAGYLADRIGRKRVLQITIVWFAVFTALSGFTNSFGELMVTRSLQGLGFGGEWAAGAALMSEVIRKEYRGRAVGAVQSGWSVGYGVAAILFALVFSVLPRDIAWRVLFWIGFLPAIAVLFFRRNLEEPEVFRQSRLLQAKSGKKVSVGEIFKGRLFGLTATASLLAAAALGGNYTILSWLPTYLSEVRHLSVLGTGGYLIVNISGSFCGYLAAAHLSDYLGRRKTFVLCSVCAALVVAFYMFVPVGDLFSLLLGFPLGFFQSGIVAGMGAAFAEIYPTRIRATGQGFSYNFGRGIGSLLPALVGVLAAPLALNNAIGVCAVTAYVIAVIAALFLPETKGKEFTANE